MNKSRNIFKRDRHKVSRKQKGFKWLRLRDRAVACLVALSLLSTNMVSGTFAKYTEDSLEVETEAVSADEYEQTDISISEKDIELANGGYGLASPSDISSDTSSDTSSDISIESAETKNTANSQSVSVFTAQADDSMLVSVQAEAAEDASLRADTDGLYVYDLAETYNAEVLFGYDIALEDEDGCQVETNGPVRLTVEADVSEDTNVAVFAVEEGDPVALDDVAVGDGMISFTAEELTSFAALVADTELKLDVITGVCASLASSLYEEDSYRVYNYLYADPVLGDVLFVSTDSVFTITGEAAASLCIGGDDAETGDKAPMAFDIEVTLNGYETENDIEILPVYPASAEDTHAVTINILENTSLADISVKDGARLNLNLRSDLEMGDLHLAPGATVNVYTNGYTLKTGEISEGDINFSETPEEGEESSFSVAGTGALSAESIAVCKMSVAQADVTCEGMRVRDASLGSGASVDLSDGDFCIYGSLKAQGCTVSSAGLFGAPADARGRVDMSFSDITFDRVLRVGAADSSAAAVIFAASNSIFSGENVTYVHDYAISYEYAGQEISPQAAWPVFYRVSEESLVSVTEPSDGSDEAYGTEVLGSLCLSEDLASYTYAAAKEGEAALPEFSVEGYGFTGWKLGENEAVECVKSGAAGDLAFSAILSAGAVLVSFDLGYMPSKDTVDDYEKYLAAEAEGTDGMGYTQTDADGHALRLLSARMGDVVVLPDVARFGYEFGGWTVSGDDTVHTGTISLSLSILSQASEESAYSLSLTPVWTPVSFPVCISLANNYEYAEISFDGGENFSAPSAAASFFSWDDGAKVLQSKAGYYINYGESLGEYFSRLGLSYPTLRDKRAAGGNSSVKQFAVWMLSGQNTALSENSLYTLGDEYSILNAGESALAAYQQTLFSTPLTMADSWGKASFSINVAAYSGWTYFVTSDNVQREKTPENGIISAENGDTVTLAVKKSAGKVVSGWTLTAKSGETIYISMRQSQTSDEYYYYDFTMPASDVTAVYRDLSSAIVYVDMAGGDYIQADGISYMGKTDISGFWYTAQMEAKTYKDITVNAMTPLFMSADMEDFEAVQKTDADVYYFYEYTSTNIYLTSCGSQTATSATVKKQSYIYLKYLNFQAKDAYKADFTGRMKLVNGKSETLELANSWENGYLSDADKYGNIIKDTDSGENFALSIYSDGDNSAGVITQSKVYFDKSFAKNIKIYGKNLNKTTDSLTLSGLFANDQLYIYSITLNEDTSVPCEYMVYLTCAVEGITHLYIYGADINARNKRLYTQKGYFLMYDFKSKSSTVRVGSLETHNTASLNGSSYLRVYGDFDLNRSGVSMTGSSSAVIDGYVDCTTTWYGINSTIDTSGFYIVKGNRANLANTTIKKGTVVVNDAMAERTFSMMGGTLVTNQLSNRPLKTMGVNKEDGTHSCKTYTGIFSEKEASSNNDAYPFQTYPNKASQSGEYSISGGSMYLFGHYKLSGNAFDASVQAVDADNPLSSVLAGLLDENGDLKSGASLSASDLQTKISENGSDAECLLLGRSNENSGTYDRSVQISGGNIYAAGNLSFFTDTSISGGTISCHGSLSCKNDLTISGTANISATAVGNCWNLTHTDEYGITSYKQTNITGGTIKTDELGALSASYGNASTTAMSSLTVSGGSISPKNGSAVSVRADRYINYIYSADDFTFTPSVTTASFSGTSYDSLEIDAVSFGLPLCSDGTYGSWLYGSLTGPVVTGIGDDVCFTTSEEGANGKAYTDNTSICLYAVKSNYAMNVSAGKENIEKISVGGKDYTGFSSAISVTRGSSVQMVLNDASYADKYVIYYKTAGGEIYNVVSNASGKTITFDMPNSDIYILVTDTMTLYLDQSEIEVTADGFCTEYSGSSCGKAFKYAGNIKISQQNISGTKVASNKTVTTSNGYLNDAVGTTNRIHISGSQGKRKIILSQILMYGATDRDGIIIEANLGDISLSIDGASTMMSIYCQAGNHLSMAGENGDVSKDYIYFRCIDSAVGQSYGYIHNKQAAMGIVDIRDIGVYYGDRTLVLSYAKAEAGDITFENVSAWTKMNANGGTLAMGYNVTFKNSRITVDSDATYTSNYGVVYAKNEMTFDGGSFSYIIGTSIHESIPFFRLSTTVLLKNGAEVSLKERTSTSSQSYKVNYALSKAGQVVLESGAKLISDHRLLLSKLVMRAGGGAAPAIYVGQETDGEYDGILMSQNISLESGSIYAGCVVISGYLGYKTTSTTYAMRSDAITAMNAETADLVSGPSCRFTMTGGEVHAGALGGSRGGSVTISGGKVYAKELGALPRLYGIAHYVPKDTESEWYYTVETIPTAMTLSVSGDSAVGISDGGYIGGMYSALSVSGGSLSLGDGAAAGLSEADAQTFYADCVESGKNISAVTAASVSVLGAAKISGDSGSINAEYGTVSISGTANVQTAAISALHGSIEISETSTGIQNSYENPKDNQVGVSTKLLTGQNITISDGAIVYAQSAVAYADAGETASLSVPAAGNGAQAYLYAGTCGTDGEGEASVSGEKDGYIITGLRQYSIHYDLRDDETDRAENPETNPSAFSYTAGSSASVEIESPTRFGYDFLGWYAEEDQAAAVEASGREDENNVITKVLCSVSGDVTLYAAWQAKNVRFRVSIDSSTSGISSSELSEQFGKLAGGTAAFENGRLTFSAISSAGYRKLIFGTDGVDVSEYALPAFSVSAMKISGEGWSGVSGLDMGSSLVSRDLMTYYYSLLKTDQNAVVDLTVSVMARKNIRISLSINRSASGLPADAAFCLDTAADNQPASASADLVTVLAADGADADDIQGLYVDEGLLKAKAPGYIFKGWFSNEDGTGDELTDSFVASADATAYYYASWEKGLIGISFDAGDGFVTETAARTGADEEKHAMSAFAYYDTLLSGNLAFADSAAAAVKFENPLPYAWHLGEKFLGWSVLDPAAEDFDISAAAKTVITNEALCAAELGEYFTFAYTGDVAGNITLHAIFRPVEISYHANGGSFTASWLAGTGRSASEDGAVDESPTAAGALAGFGKTNADGLEAKVIYGDFSVYSTTAAYYDANKKYAAGDYREALGKKGYTFLGWHTDAGCTEETLCGSASFYDDTDLYAEWSANTYNVTLKKPASASSYISGSGAEASVQLLVGQEIGTGDGTENWPGRKDASWYAADDQTSDTTRPVLGFTFDSLDPGQSGSGGTGYVTYQTYSKYLLVLQNIPAVFDKKQTGDDGASAGSIFYLPEDEAYGPGVVPGTKVVPDYPDGASFDMYALYRERSLVFTERYVDSETGEVIENVIRTVSASAYNSYPDSYKTDTSANYAAITAAGYTLAGWYINTTEADAGRKYSEENYTSGDDAVSGTAGYWMKDANLIGSYDVHVYTVYTVQIHKTIAMYASQTPTQSMGSSLLYTVPDSVAEGSAGFSFAAADGDESAEKFGSEAGLKLVPYTELFNHLFDAEWTENGKAHTAQDTAAIRLKILDAQNIEKMDAWLSADGFNTDFAVKKGYKFVFTLYTSAVVPDTKTYLAKLCGTFPDVESQELSFDMSVSMRKTLWNVEYHAFMPDDEYRVLENENGFAKDAADSNIYSASWQGSYTYGADLLKKVPAFTGYDWDEGWYYFGADGAGYTGDLAAYSEENNGTKAAVTKAGDIKLSANNAGTIKLYAGYVPKGYSITVADDVSAGWTVAYSEKDTGSAKYHTAVTLSPGTNARAEFINLTFGTDESRKTLRLDALSQESDLHAAKENGTYSFLMPDMPVEISYKDVAELYLDDGSISLADTGYTQNGVFSTWSGEYIVRQNAENTISSDRKNAHPENTLKIDFSSAKEVSLGNVESDTDDSITISGAISLSLLGCLDVKNISMSDESSLTINTDTKESEEAGEISLSPSRGKAGIGGNGISAINIANAEISAKMPAGSTAAVIGTFMGSEEESGTKISLSGTKVTVSEGQSQAQGSYTGCWLGGDGVEEVLADDGTELLAGDEQSGTELIYAENVTLRKSTAGTSSAPISDHRIAAENITIQTTSAGKACLYLDVTNKSPVLCAEDSITVDDGNDRSSASEIMITGNSPANDLYEGRLLLKNACAHVVISDILVVDAGSYQTYNAGGNINLAKYSNGEPYCQVKYGYSTSQAQSWTHSGGIMIIDDLYDGAKNAYIYISYMTPGKYVYVGQNAEDKVTLGSMRCTCSVDMQVFGSMKLASSTKSDISTGETLSVSAEGASVDLGAGINNMLSSSGNSFHGSYSQTGGSLSADGDLVVDGNLSLSGVTADFGTNKLGSCSYYAVAYMPYQVTSVSVEDSKITAGTLGALGTQGKTPQNGPAFTFLKLSGENDLNTTAVGDICRLSFETDNLPSGYSTGYFSDGSPMFRYRSLRESSVYTGGGTAVSTSFSPDVPAEPRLDSITTSRFETWYAHADGYDDMAVQRVKPDGFKKAAALSDSYLTYALAAASDGTQTLNLYPFISASGSTKASGSEQYAKFTADENITVQTGGALSADLSFGGTYRAEAMPVITFANKLPAGTRIMAGMDGKWWYTCLEEETGAIRLSDLTSCSGGDAFALEAGENKYVSKTLRLVADFSDVSEISENTLSLSLDYGDAGEGLDILAEGTECSYNVTDAQSGSISMSDIKSADGSLSFGLSATLENMSDKLSGKELYALVKLDSGSALPYLLSLKAEKDEESISGKQVGDKYIFFDMGKAENMTERISVNVDGLKDGNYTLSAYLYAADEKESEDVCVMDTLLASSTEASVSHTGAAEPSLKVDIENPEDLQTVYSPGDTAVVSYKASTNQSSYSVVTEKQTAFGTYVKQYESEAVTADEASLQMTLENEGSYRIRLSIDDDSSWDDVYIPLIAEKN